jgi:hypothetical protein
MIQASRATWAAGLRQKEALVLNKFYLTLGSVLLLGYSVMAFTGWELGDMERHSVPEEYRNSQGYRSWHGYRGPHIIYAGGYRGGK